MTIAASALDFPSLMRALPLAMASLIDGLFKSIFFGSAATTGAGEGAGAIAATGVVAGTGALTVVAVVAATGAVGFATTGATAGTDLAAGAVIFLVMIFVP